MKKLIAMLAVVFAVALIPTVFVGCGKKETKGAAKEYTITFNYMGKADNEEVVVEKGGKVKKPAVKVLEGLEVSGWYTDETLTTAYKFSDEVTANTTLYAKWTDPYTYTEVEGGYAINGYKGSAKEAILPSTHNSQPVVEIQSCYNESYTDYVSIFYNKNVAKVTLPNTLKVIGEGAFYSAEKIAAIIIPASVTEICEYAFNYCRNLQAVVFEENSQLTTINNSAFENCIKLSNINLPNNLLSIGSYAFSNTAITQITIPEGIKTISCALFINCAELQNIMLPEGIEKIEAFAFNGCQKLKSITIPASVTTIEGFWHYEGNGGSGNSMFGGCAALTSVAVAPGNTVYDSRENCNAIIETSTNKLIAGCNTSTIPNGVETICYGAFECCDELTQIEFPNTLTTIEAGVFSSCNGLSYVMISETITAIASDAFSSCYNLQTVLLNSNSIYNQLDSEFNPFTYSHPQQVTIYVPKTFVEENVNEYLENNFTKQDGTGEYENYYAYTSRNEA